MSTALMWAVLLLALAAFPIMATRAHLAAGGSASEPDLLYGFAYVGALAAVVLAVAVIVVAAVAPAGARADTLAMLGLFGLTLFHLAGLILWRIRRSHPALDPDQPPRP